MTKVGKRGEVGNQGKNKKKEKKIEIAPWKQGAFSQMNIMEKEQFGRNRIRSFEQLI